MEIGFAVRASRRRPSRCRSSSSVSAMPRPRGARSAPQRPPHGQFWKRWSFSVLQRASVRERERERESQEKRERERAYELIADWARLARGGGGGG